MRPFARALALLALLAPLAAAVRPAGAETLATTAFPLEGRRAELRTGSTNLGNLHADAVLEVARAAAGALSSPVAPPIAAIVNAGGIRIDRVIPPGALSAGDVAQIAGFDNKLVILPALPVASLKAGLERGVAHIGAGEPRGAFPQLAGLGVTYRADRPEGSRIQSIELADGTVLVQDGAVAPGAPATISLVTHSYLSGGGDGYPWNAVPSVMLEVTERAALTRFLQQTLTGVVDGPALAPDAPPRVRRLDQRAPDQPAAGSGR